ncbi:hypothetical protein BJ508DRAFT_325600 [Ascobolus immersus RN42]|uniref:Uncharacterized protein n=1 Tax=Ascobolus immersus RN42 TaxID=1160509 RepID=A0A3N4I8C4_ASCIM|nr:hypothetical protein BJ508DRAFT_325600 [Ascobolus immersus RN42]
MREVMTWDNLVQTEEQIEKIRGMLGISVSETVELMAPYWKSEKEPGGRTRRLKRAAEPARTKPPKRMRPNGSWTPTASSVTSSPTASMRQRYSESPGPYPGASGPYPRASGPYQGAFGVYTPATSKDPSLCSDGPREYDFDPPEQSTASESHLELEALKSERAALRQLNDTLENQVISLKNQVDAEKKKAEDEKRKAKEASNSATSRTKELIALNDRFTQATRTLADVKTKLKGVETDYEEWKKSRSLELDTANDALRKAKEKLGGVGKVEEELRKAREELAAFGNVKEELRKAREELATFGKVKEELAAFGKVKEELRKTREELAALGEVEGELRKAKEKLAALGEVEEELTKLKGSYGKLKTAEQMARDLVISDRTEFKEREAELEGKLQEAEQKLKGIEAATTQKDAIEKAIAETRQRCAREQKAVTTLEVTRAENQLKEVMEQKMVEFEDELTKKCARKCQEAKLAEEMASQEAAKASHDLSVTQAKLDRVTKELQENGVNPQLTATATFTVTVCSKCRRRSAGPGPAKGGHSYPVSTFAAQKARIDRDTFIKGKDYVRPKYIKDVSLEEDDDLPSHRASSDAARKEGFFKRKGFF